MKLTKQTLKQIIKEELEKLQEVDSEGTSTPATVAEAPTVEFITPENIALVLQAIGPMLAAGGIAALGVDAVGKVINQIKKNRPDVKIKEPKKEEV